ncbi:MAG: F0F1 ATP synthase subunit delta [Quisquiliibacterium sp.]
MAEIATIARPYAEALFKAAGDQAAIAAVASEPQLRQFAENPRTTAEQVQEIVLSVLGQPVSAQAGNFLRAVLDNGRLAALTEIAAQFQALVDARSGVSQARIESAYPIEAGQLADVVATLEGRFGRKLEASVVVRPELIGGIRVVVGDEVLDTSVKARLEQMKVALTA